MMIKMICVLISKNARKFKFGCDPEKWKDRSYEIIRTFCPDEFPYTVSFDGGFYSKSAKYSKWKKEKFEDQRTRKKEKT